MCFLSMKTFGTVRWCVISSRASCIAAPSSGVCTAISFRSFRKERASGTKRTDVLLVGMETRRTDLVELDGVVLGAHLAEELLGRFAVGTVGFAEDGC